MKTVLFFVQIKMAYKNEMQANDIMAKTTKYLTKMTKNEAKSTCII